MIIANQSKSIYIFILIIIIAFSAMFYAFSKSNHNQQKPVVNNTNNNNQNNNDQQTNNANQELKPIILGWKVYTNKEYGFRIDYPGEWIVRKAIDEPAVSIMNPEIIKYLEEETGKKFEDIDLLSYDDYFVYHSDITIFRLVSLKDRHGVMTIDELIKGNNEISEIGKTQIDGVWATDFIWRGEGEEYVIIFKSNGYFYEIVLNRTLSKENISDTIKQILSTFQLIK